MSPEKAVESLRAEQIKLTACKLRIEGYQKLFEAQAYMGKGDEAEKIRNIIIDLTNESLDHVAAIAMFASIVIRS